MADFSSLVAKAEAAGTLALNGAKPVPIIVGEAVGIFSSKIDYSKPTYYEPEGMCGFAWVGFKSNTSFGRWMKKNKNVSDAYPTGLCVWISAGGQSIERKKAYARAYAAVLKAGGIADAYVGSRLD